MKINLIFVLLSMGFVLLIYYLLNNGTYCFLRTKQYLAFNKYWYLAGAFIGIYGAIKAVVKLNNNT